MRSQRCVRGDRKAACPLEELGLWMEPLMGTHTHSQPSPACVPGLNLLQPHLQAWFHLCPSGQPPFLSGSCLSLCRAEEDAWLCPSWTSSEGTRPPSSPKPVGFCEDEGRWEHWGGGGLQAAVPQRHHFRRGPWWIEVHPIPPFFDFIFIISYATKEYV